MGLTLIDPPAEEPVSLAEAKAHCRVDADVTDDDVLITALIVAARRRAEQITARALVTQRWRLSLNRFPADSLDLPLPPLVSVQSITYLDQAGARQPFDASDFDVITDELVGRVVPAWGKSWPACRVVAGSVLIEFTAGYGAATAVPQDIKHWVLLTVGTLYAQREALVTGTIVAEIPRAFCDGLLDPYLILRLA